MPIATEHSDPRKRRAPWWVLLFAFLALLPVGLFVWSWFSPVGMPIGPGVFGFGREQGVSTYPLLLFRTWDEQGWYVPIRVSEHDRYVILWVRKDIPPQQRLYR